jgi:hypothetical protein
MSATDDTPPPGAAAPEILEDRIWIDGCFDFFHHGQSLKSPLADWLQPNLSGADCEVKDMLVL